MTEIVTSYLSPGVFTRVDDHTMIIPGGQAMISLGGSQQFLIGAPAISKSAASAEVETEVKETETKVVDAKDAEKEEEENPADTFVDFRQKDTDNTMFSNIIVKSEDGTEFYFHRSDIMKSDVKFLKDTIRMLPEDRSKELPLSADFRTVHLILNYLYDGKGSAALDDVHDIQELISVLKFACKYDSSSTLR